MEYSKYLHKIAEEAEQLDPTDRADVAEAHIRAAAESAEGKKLLGQRSDSETLISGAGAIAGGLGGYLLSRLLHKKPSGWLRALYAAGGALAGGFGTYAALGAISDGKGRSLRDSMRLAPLLASGTPRGDALNADMDSLSKRKAGTDVLTDAATVAGYSAAAGSLPFAASTAFAGVSRLPSSLSWTAKGLKNVAVVAPQRGLVHARRLLGGGGNGLKLRPYAKMPVVKGTPLMSWKASTGCAGGAAVLGALFSLAASGINNWKSTPDLPNQ